MTLITVDAVVDVTRHPLVTEVGGVVAAMATGALENSVVIRVDMARGTNIIRVAVTGWELRVLRVVEGRTGPGSCVVAALAGSGEELRLRRVTRICAVLVIRLMAAIARGRQRRVVGVHVAI
jgi:hypothetical protein